MVNWLALNVLVLAMNKFPVNIPEAKVLAAVNLLLRFFWMILEGRVFPVVGHLIIAVLQSLCPNDRHVCLHGNDVFHLCFDLSDHEG